MKKLLKIIFTTWAFTAFLVMLILVFPVYIVFWWFFKDRTPKILYSFTRCWGSSVAFAFFTTYKRKINFIPDKHKSYIFVCNHRSLMDIPISAYLIKNPFRFYAKQELTKIPLLGKIIKIICITVDRNALANKYSSFELMKQCLESGESVLIFPEGTRSPSNLVLNDFQNGAFKLAKETLAPIIPITLWNTSKISTTETGLLITPSKIHCFVDQEISPEEISTSDIKALKEKLSSIMLANIESVKK